MTENLKSILNQNLENKKIAKASQSNIELHDIATINLEQAKDLQKQLSYTQSSVQEELKSLLKGLNEIQQAYNQAILPAKETAQVMQELAGRLSVYYMTVNNQAISLQNQVVTMNKLPEQMENKTQEFIKGLEKQAQEVIKAVEKNHDHQTSYQMQLLKMSDQVRAIVGGLQEVWQHQEAMLVRQQQILDTPPPAPKVIRIQSELKSHLTTIVTIVSLATVAPVLWVSLIVIFILQLAIGNLMIPFFIILILATAVTVAVPLTATKMLQPQQPA